MSDNTGEMPEKGEPVSEVTLEPDLMKLFDEMTFREKWRKVLAGLKAPKDSGDYKFAKFQLMRLSAPIAAVLVPIIAIMIMAVMSAMAPEPVTQMEVTVIEPEKMEEKLEEIKEIIEEPLEPPPPEEMVMTDDPTRPAGPPSETALAPSPDTDFSPQPADFDSVAIVKSPVIMKGIYGSRTPGARGSALAKYGGGGGGGGGTEGAVLRALRWLKREQKPDGSWDQPPVAMTSWALLCYLAHGETPASEEFGMTVEKAIKYLAEHQSSWPVRYEWAIATYAMSEAYGMTRIPMLKDVATKGLERIIKGQNPGGGWDYGLNNTDRNDTSVMGWCAQALKAGKLAGIEVDGLENAIREAIKGFKGNAAPTGGFGYTGPGSGGLTAAGVLCMQLLGAAKDPACRQGLAVMDPWVFKYNAAGGPGADLYYWYYATQAKFHAGGEIWNNWNKMFSIELVNSQIILKGAGVDGKDIGYWECPKGADGKEVKGHSTGLVYNTCLNCLQLEVYYRYLPTYKEQEVIDLAQDTGTSDEISIEVRE